MSNSIKISTQVLRDTSEKVNRINLSLDDKLKDINRKMDSLQETWRSDAGEEIREAMRALNPRFDKYKEVVTSYSKFLIETAEEYEYAETSIESNAAEFKKM